MNRIAWLGQAAICYHKGIPSTFRGGWQLLNEEQQAAANGVALECLNRWLTLHGIEEVPLSDALLIEKQSEIY